MKKNSKKLLSALLATVMVLCSLPFAGVTFSAGAEYSGYYTYMVENGEATITDCDTSISGDVVIPDTLVGYPVTSIGYRAFEDCTGLTSITISDGVTSIGNYAFYGCTGLTSITIPDSVTSIGDSAFSRCTGLTKITVSSGNTVYHSTDNCLIETESKTLISGCKNSIIPSDGSVTSIGGYAFYSCTGLTSVTIPNGVTSIGDYAFDYCTGLISVTIGNRVTSIGDYAFYRCTGLTSITIPDSVTSIGDSAFSSCTGLTSVTIGNSVTSIGNYAFRDCTGLTSITIPNSVTSIGWGAFFYCTGLTSVTIPDSVTSIGNSAFRDCTGLTSITIPDSVMRIGDGAFNGCTSLTSITVYPGNTVYHSTNNCLIETKSKTLILGCKNSVIPSDGSVTSIGEDAFRNCTGLTSITIPDSVTSIGKSAFYGCTGLTDVYYSGSEEEWGKIGIGSYNVPLGNATIHYNSGSGGENPDNPGTGEEDPETPTDRTAYHGILDNYVTTVVLNGNETYASEIVVDGVSYKVQKNLLTDFTLLDSYKGKDVAFSVSNGIVVWFELVSNLETGVLVSVEADNPIINYYGNGKYSADKISLNINVYNTLKDAGDVKELMDIDSLSVYIAYVKLKIKTIYGTVLDEIDIPINRELLVGTSLTYENAAGITIDKHAVIEDDTFIDYTDISCDMICKKNGNYLTVSDSMQIQIYNKTYTKPQPTNPTTSNPQNPSTNDDQLAKKAADELKRLQKSTANGVISLNGSADLIGLLGSDTLEAIGAKMLSIIVLASAPKETFDEVLTDTVIEKVFGAKKWFQIWNNKVAFDVVVNTKNYGEVKIRFTSENPVYNFNGKDLGSLGFVMYEITGNKKALKKLKDDNFPITGTAGGFATYDMDAFCQAAYSFVKSELKKSYNIAYGNDSNQAVNFILGKSVNKLLSYTKYGSASGLYWELLTIAGKEYKIECPVDVYVYDSENNLVAAVENNKEVLSNDNVKIEINGDTKYIRLYNDNYRIVYNATANGSMRVTVNEMANLDTSLRTVVIDDIPLSAGVSYSQNSDEKILEDSEYALTANDGTVYNADSDTVNFHDHVSNGVWFDGDASTCTEKGWKCSICTVCNEWFKEYLDIAEHTDNDNNGVCDSCGEKLSETEPENPSANCSCMCHKTGFMGFIYKIARFFWKLFKKNQVCKCGAWHY